MEKPKGIYPNAGAQKRLARREMRRYGDGTDDDYLPITTVAMLLGIGRNKVIQTLIPRRLIDKRAYYLRSDVQGWIANQINQPGSLLEKLRDDYAKAKEKIRKQPSRVYISGQQSSSEAVVSKKRTEQIKDSGPADSYELQQVIRKAERWWGGSPGHAALLLDKWMKPKKAKPTKKAK